MTLQELINWAKEQGVEDFNQCELEFNCADGGFQCFIGVEKIGLSIEETENPATGAKYQTIFIDSY